MTTTITTDGEQRSSSELVRPASALVIMAHADDAEFGASGTIAQWTDKGSEVNYVVCTNGDRGTADASLSQRTLVEMREEEQRAAARTVGAREVVFLGYADGGIEPSRELRKDLVAQIRRFKPETVICPDPYRPFSPFVSHRDHIAVGQAAADAASPLAGQALMFREQYQKGVEPHQVHHLLFAAPHQPNVWIDIEPVFDRKIEALMCHSSQMGDREQVEQMVRNMSGQLAEGHDLELAETFRHEPLRWEWDY